jgi:hypothetical protein
MKINTEFKLDIILIVLRCTEPQIPLAVANFATVQLLNPEITRQLRSSELIAPAVVYLTLSITFSFRQCQRSGHIGNGTSFGVCMKL